MYIKQLIALAEKGDYDAKMVLSMRRDVLQYHHQYGRRWRNACYTVQQLQAQGKEPQTCREWVNMAAHYGLEPINPLTEAQLAQRMRLDQFRRTAGGFTTTDDYPAEGEPDAPAKCDVCCKKAVARMCSWCGEGYCDPNCYMKGLKDHIPACLETVERLHCGLPPTPRPELWTAQQYASVYGLAPPAAAASRNSGSSTAAAARSGGSSSAAATSAAQPTPDMARGMSFMGPLVGVQQQPPVGMSKSQKKKAKRREKEKKAAAAAADAGAAAAGGSLAAEGSSATEQQQQQQQPEGSLAAEESSTTEQQQQQKQQPPEGSAGLISSIMALLGFRR